MNKVLKTVRGFTLVEVMVVVIIVGILAALAVPLYRDYVNQGTASEGQALVASVAAAEKVYYSQHNQCTPVSGGGGVGDTLGVVVTQNSYFTSYDVPAPGGTAVGGLGVCSFSVQAKYLQPDGTTLVVTLDQPPIGPPTTTVTSS